MSSKPVQFIRKSNDLVEARYRFDIWETRIFTKMLTMVRRDDEDFKDYRIYLKDIIRDFNLEKTKGAYEHLRNGARKLKKKEFYIYYEVDGVKRLFETPIIAGMDSAVLDGRKVGAEQLYLEVSFHPKMKPYLLQLKSQFTMYDVKNILRLPSTHSIRIYELLKQYEKIGWRVFQVDELKEILGIGDKYKLYGHLKKRIIEKSQRDLAAHTDIKFTFEEIKIGRAVDRIKFIIRRNRPHSAETMTSEVVIPVAEIDVPNTDYSELFIELYPKIKKWMGQQAFINLLEKVPADQIRRAITYTLNRLAAGHKIKNVAGYLTTLASEKNLFDPVDDSRAAARAAKHQERANAERQATLEKEIKRLRKAAYEREWALALDLLKESDTLQAQAQQAVANSRTAARHFQRELPLLEQLEVLQIKNVVLAKVKKVEAAKFAGVGEELAKAIERVKRS